MAQRAVVNNGAPILELEEGVIGSQLRIAVYFERLVSEDPDVFQPFDFTGMTLQADLKLKPSKEAEADAELTCVPRDDLGWVDLSMDGTLTATLVDKPYEGSLKVWPDGHPELGDTLLIIKIPMKYKATR